jgi:hypothetical protein
MGGRQGREARFETDVRLSTKMFGLFTVPIVAQGCPPCDRGRTAPGRGSSCLDSLCWCFSLGDA